VLPDIIVPVGLGFLCLIEELRQSAGGKIRTVGADIRKTLYSLTYRFIGEIFTEFVAVLMTAEFASSVNTMGAEPDLITAFLESAFVSPIDRNTDIAIIFDFFADCFVITSKSQRDLFQSNIYDTELLLDE